MTNGGGGERDQRQNLSLALGVHVTSVINHIVELCPKPAHRHNCTTLIRAEHITRLFMRSKQRLGLHIVHPPLSSYKTNHAQKLPYVATCASSQLLYLNRSTPMPRANCNTQAEIQKRTAARVSPPKPSPLNKLTPHRGQRAPPPGVPRGKLGAAECTPTCR